MSLNRWRGGTYLSIVSCSRDSSSSIGDNIYLFISPTASLELPINLTCVSLDFRGDSIETGEEEKTNTRWHRENKDLRRAQTQKLLVMRQQRTDNSRKVGRSSPGSSSLHVEDTELQFVPDVSMWVCARLIGRMFRIETFCLYEFMCDVWHLKFVQTCQNLYLIYFCIWVTHTLSWYCT